MKNKIFKKLWKWLLKKITTIDWEKVVEWIWNKIKEVDWQAKIYKFWEDKIRPKLLNYVEDTKNKFDDIMFKGLDKIIDTYLKPEKQGQTIPFSSDDY